MRALPYRLGINEGRQPVIISALLFPDGRYTSSLGESVGDMLRPLFKHDNVRGDTLYQAAFQRCVLNSPFAAEDRFFSLDEVTQVISHLPKRTTPKLNVIRTIDLQVSFSAHPSFSFACFQ